MRGQTFSKFSKSLFAREKKKLPQRSNIKRAHLEAPRLVNKFSMVYNILFTTLDAICTLLYVCLL